MSTDHARMNDAKTNGEGLSAYNPPIDFTQSFRRISPFLVRGSIGVPMIVFLVALVVILALVAIMDYQLALGSILLSTVILTIEELHNRSQSTKRRPESAQDPVTGAL